MRRPEILGVIDVFVHVDDLETTGRWYAELLGDANNAEPGSPIRHFPFENGPGILLDSNRNNRGGTRPLFQLEVDDIEAAAEWLAASGATLRGDVELHGNVKFLRFADPEGNALMLVQRVK